MQISLNTLREQFKHYRAEKKSTNKVPELLKSQVLNSLRHYSRKQVMAATGLASSTLYHWRKDDIGAEALPAQAADDLDFIHIPLPNNNCDHDMASLGKTLTMTSNLPEMEIIIGDCKKIIIRGYTIEQTNGLLCMLAQGGSK